MKKALKLILSVFLSVLLLHGISFATAIIYFDQPIYNQNIGDSFTADLNIAGLGDMSPDSLGVFDIDIAYDSTVLSLSSISFGDQLDLFGLGSIASTTPFSGGVNVFELSLDSDSDLDSLQAGTFTLFSLNFEAVADGNSALLLSINTLGDSSGGVLQHSINDSIVHVSNPIPEPGTSSLIILGLLCFAGLNRRTMT